ncbi:MAG: polyphosphate kinase 1 [Clostridia bacterium]|nr:polyphosphate kinase 1 [Clostridia bacterium]
MPQPAKEQKNTPGYFVNRELSWLAFNKRVLMEAANPDNPVFERMKFLSIVSSNLDEFFMIRTAGIRDLCNADIKQPDEAGLTPKQQLNRIMPRVQRMIQQQYKILREQVLPDLRACGVRILAYDELDTTQAEWALRYFLREVYPVLTPMAVDANRPFPHILNRSLNLGVLLHPKQGDVPDFATVQVPSGLSRVVALPGCAPGAASFLLLEELIARHIHLLFVGRRVLCCTAYRITRAADFPVDEEDAVSILTEVQKSIKKRKWGAVIRLEIAHDAEEEMLRMLRRKLKATRSEVYSIHGPINLDFLLKQVYAAEGFAAHKYESFEPRVPPELRDVEGDAFFEAIRRGDILLHHPYDSFEPVLRFLQEAAQDPRVLAIKQTLYRVSGHSPVVRALADAADAGKQVTVMLEIKARFDEENNIQWGRRLERAGCHVVYGLPGLKTHSKTTLVVRREDDGIHRYVHLSTGNYNDITAHIYTDIGLFTARPEYGEDATAFFNMLTGYSEAPALRRLIYAPNHLRAALLERIRREEKHALDGRPSGIAAKLNSLHDTKISDALCRAAAAGAPVRLLVRGICGLRPGLPGRSEGVEVRSIVGRFLEHSRIFCFVNGGEEEVFLSSADWMGRNLDRRVELMFPVEDPALRARVREVLERGWRDTEKAWVMNSKGNYSRVRRRESEPRLNSQASLIEG